MTTWIFRIGFFVAPVMAFVVTRRICLGLQRRDQQVLEEGVESGLIMLRPDGSYAERHVRPPEETEAVLNVRRPASWSRPTRTTSSRSPPPTASARRSGPASTAST